MKLYDVIIVGAGPAGLMAARELSRVNKNYLLIDSKKVIGYPLKCAEGISESTFIKFFGHKNYPFVRNTVHSHVIRYKNFERSFDANFLQLDRPKWELWMSKGLNIKLNCRLEDVNITKAYAELQTSSGLLRTKLLILCNGCNFHIQKKLQLTSKNPLIAIAYGGIYKNYIGIASKHRNTFVSDAFYYYFDEEFFGYLWIFPKNSDEANIGIAFYPVSHEHKDPRLLLDKFLKKYDIKVEKISEYAGIIPCSGPISKTYSNRIMVCGDSAGMVYAGTGEGIKYALTSGRLAALTAIKSLHLNRFDKHFLKKYENAWKKEFGREMIAGELFFDLTVAATRIGKIKSLFRIPSDKEVRELVLEGKYPFKAWLAWKLCKLFGWTKIK